MREAINDLQSNNRCLGGKRRISSVEMDCLNFPSLAELCTHQIDISFETRPFQDAREQGVLPLTAMERPKQPANLRGELFSKLN